MAAPQFDKKQVLEIFKYLNAGGIAAVVVIGLVTGVMYGSGCGPIVHSDNYGDEHLSGAPVLQDHPEAVSDDHGDEHADDHADDHGDGH